MRLLLDAQLSGRVVGRHLRDLGHDVLALDEHRELEGLSDLNVFEVAIHEQRILITPNVQDFPEIVHECSELGRDHAGCIILVGVRLDAFGPLVKRIQVALARTATQELWVNQVMYVGAGDIVAAD